MLSMALAKILQLKFFVLSLCTVNTNNQMNIILNVAVLLLELYEAFDLVYHYFINSKIE